MTGKGIIKSAQETIVAAGKSAAEEAKALAGEVVHAAATAAITTTAGVVLDKVATAIEAGAAKDAKALAGSRARKKVVKRVAVKKRAAPKKKANTKKASRKAAKKKRI